MSFRDPHVKFIYSSIQSEKIVLNNTDLNCKVYPPRLRTIYFRIPICSNKFLKAVKCMIKALPTVTGYIDVKNKVLLTNGIIPYTVNEIKYIKTLRSIFQIAKQVPLLMNFNMNNDGNKINNVSFFFNHIIMDGSSFNMVLRLISNLFIDENNIPKIVYDPRNMHNILISPHLKHTEIGITKCRKPVLYDDVIRSYLNLRCIILFLSVFYFKAICRFIKPHFELINEFKSYSQLDITDLKRSFDKQTKIELSDYDVVLAKFIIERFGNNQNILLFYPVDFRRFFDGTKFLFGNNARFIRILIQTGDTLLSIAAKIRRKMLQLRNVSDVIEDIFSINYILDTPPSLFETNIIKVIATVYPSLENVNFGIDCDIEFDIYPTKIKYSNKLNHNQMVFVCKNKHGFDVNYQYFKWFSTIISYM